MSVELSAIPMSALVDDLLHIEISRLNPWQLVTLAAVLVEDANEFVSVGLYVSDGDGRLDLDKSSSHGGTYRGVEPMGLLWSMKPAPGQRKGLRLVKQDVSQPFVVDIFLLKGHIEITSKKDIDASSELLLGKTTIRRYYQGPGVTAFKVRAGVVRGVLFLPPGDGPFPGVIDLFGTAGGLMAFRAALLASRGFAALALPYFNYEDLPKNMDLDLEYFEEAVDWLFLVPCVLKTGLGVVGVSKGAALALYMGTVCDKVRAVVSINGNCMQNVGYHTYHGEAQPVANADLDDNYHSEEGFIIGKGYRYQEEHKDALIPIENAKNAEFLFVVGQDDPSNYSQDHAEIIVSRLKQHGKDNYRILTYPGAGHLIEPPYTPHCRLSHAKIVGMPILYGGETRAHAAAQESSWREMLSFLWKRLDPDHRNYQHQHHWNRSIRSKL